MKEIRLLANINPLNINCLYEVATSRHFACGFDEAKELFEKYGKELKEKGHLVELEIITRQTIKL